MTGEMQLFTLSITDLTTFESVPHEEWAETEDLFEVGNAGNARRKSQFSSPRYVRGNLRRSWNSGVGDATRHPAIESPYALPRIDRGDPLIPATLLAGFKASEPARRISAGELPNAANWAA